MSAEERVKRERVLVLAYEWFLEELRERYGNKPLSIYVKPDEQWRL
jgi:hypothetical protein